jgi:hypothetical protein
MSKKDSKRRESALYFRKILLTIRKIKICKSSKSSGTYTSANFFLAV